MEHKTSLIKYAELELKVRYKLLEYGIILTTDKVKLRPYHNVVIHGERFFHFVITCINSRQTFFLKVVKENDNSLLCDLYLKKICTKDREYLYPQIIVPKFSFKGMQYYITTYIEGLSLDTFPDTLPQNIWGNIADKLLFLIDQLTSLKALQYSEHGIFVEDDYASILIKKLETRLKHPLIANYLQKKFEQVLNWFNEILDHSHFSQPTLIHMDVKPANIIYNADTGAVSLIDFEFARFGDIDYGWTQILLSGCNQFNQFYKKQIIPYMTSGRLTLDDAFEIPKFQCYLFYQVMCNLIYYHDHHSPCPKEMQEIFNFFVNRI